MSIRGITAGSNVTSAAASDVTFLQSGTGAVSRTVQAKLSDVPSTDDWGTASQAVTALSAGGVVIVNPADTPTLPASYPSIVFDYYGPATPINVYQESGETTRFGKRVLRGQNAGNHNGNEYSLFVVEHHPVGSGTNGPTHADYALTVVNQKQDFDTTSVVGETDGILIVVRNGGTTSDGAGILANVVSYGTGFMAAMEATTAIISGVTTQQSIQTQVGVVDNVSLFYLGFYTKANTGTLHNAFRADTSATATWDYLFRGYENGVEKFSVTGIGKINLFDSSGNKKSVVCEANALNVYANDGTTVIFQVNNSGNGAFLGNVSGALFGIGSAGISSTTRANITASTAGISSLRIAHGTAPSAPVDGDMWTTAAGLYVRINGATVGPLS
jgi:hypothetical protein